MDRAPLPASAACGNIRGPMELSSAEREPGAWRRLRHSVAATQVAAWRQPSATRSINLLLGTWVPIVVAAFVALVADSVLVYGLAAAWIGVRQIAVFNLMHEGVHGTLWPDRRLNDRLSDCFGAWPLATTTARYRRSHLLHHRRVGRLGDPDLETIYRRRRHGRLWPQGRVAAVVQLIADVSGLTFLRNLLVRDRRVDFVLPANSSASWMRRLGLAAAAVVGLVALHGAGLLQPILLLWVVPLMTTFQVVMRLHQWGDHLGLDPTAGPLATRHVEVGWLGRLLCAPTFSNHHLAHHLFPAVPCYHLPQVQAHLDACAVDLVPRAQGYVFGRNSVLAQVAAAPVSVHSRTCAVLEA